MARKPTDKQLFKMKNEWLGQFYEEVKPRDFYRAVFPEGSFEREGHPEDEKCNGVLTVIEGEKARNYIVFDELNFAEPIRAVIPINLLLLLILVHIVYVLIRWYVKGCMRSRGYY